MSDVRYPLSGPTPRHGVLHEGVPIWLRESVRSWLEASLEKLIRNYNDDEVVHVLARMFDLHARLEDPLAPKIRNVFLWSVVMNRDDELVLDFVDFLLPSLVDVGEVGCVEDLDRVLKQGGSAWRVATRQGKPGMERRVDEVAIAAADKAISESGHAGVLLEEAWQRVFGRQPDPKGAFSKAVLAVEEAAAPVVSPNNLKATLGTIARDMGNQGDWRYVLHDATKADAKDAPLRQIQELWFGDPRHADGTATYSDPTAEEAETAVFLAVGLVHMFKHGLIARLP